eukprot:TRINITY_DN55593_c0_g1_i1.p1 TRINITY_DN55593_c0_g1~~TRINITY_DN55593_c0_g1_i1.p1  ORF type:complete len:457 (+),score=25.20 TRINITY_DN55593_c0_g1_i1:55-1425(+)
MITPEGADPMSVQLLSGSCAEPGNGVSPWLVPAGETAKVSWLSWRLRVAILLFLCNVSLAMCRVNMSVVIEDLYPSTVTQGVVLSAYYWGYAASQLPAGMLTMHMGGNAVVCIASAVWSAATLLTAFAYDVDNVWPLAFCRCIAALAQGCNYPAQSALATQWFPDSEKSGLYAFMVAGDSIGIIITFLAGPWLTVDGNWRLLFYVCAACSAFTFVLLATCCSRSPETHGRISSQELSLILAGRKAMNTASSTPWCAILTNRAFIALVFTHSCNAYGYYMGISWTQEFFRDVLHVGTASLSIVTMCPYVALFVFSIAGGKVADWMLRSGLSLAFTRKVINTSGFAVSAVCLILLPIAGRSGSLPLSVALSCAAVGAMGWSYAGFWSNFLDLSPVHASVLLGFSNSITGLPGVLGQIVTGKLLSGNAPDWDAAFLVAAASSAVGALMFLVWGRTSQQF